MKAIPEPYYSLVDTSIGGEPAVVVVNSALRCFEGRSHYPWLLLIEIDFRALAQNGMPTADEVEIVNRLEDGTLDRVRVGGNAIFLARVTAKGQRKLHYRVHDAERANQVLQDAASVSDPLREWAYEIRWDEDWAMSQGELDLVANARNRN